jgi:DnaA regulatory inactivator Hda
MIQLVLSLTTQRRFTFRNLVIHEGLATAAAALESVYVPNGPPFPPVFLYGPTGTGKTHVLNALALLLEERCNEEFRQMKLVGPVGDPQRFPDLERLVAGSEIPEEAPWGVALDDAHLLDPKERAHLWNLSNKLTRAGGPLIIAALHSPDETFGHDPHLKSRVTAGLVYRLEPPEDNVRVLILDKLARDRNIRLAQDVCNYLVTRKSRNVKELERIIEILDRASLQLKRRITIPLVKLMEKDGYL